MRPFSHSGCELVGRVAAPNTGTARVARQNRRVALVYAHWFPQENTWTAQTQFRPAPRARGALRRPRAEGTAYGSSLRIPLGRTSLWLVATSHLGEPQERAPHSVGVASV